LYEIGAFYSKHLDQFKNNDSRKYSVIMYLNTNWLETDGGALTVYFDGNQYDILPENGKIVFFNSSKLLHEVQVSNRQRLSITGWLKVDAL
jgi:SM-20-related protein